MKSQTEESNMIQEHSLQEDEFVQKQESQEASEMEKVIANEGVLEDLHKSVERLHKFVDGLTEESVTVIPNCVQSYCDKISEYRVRNKEEVMLLAERRVNKMIRNKKVKRNWNGRDISLLVWVISQRVIQRGLTNFSQMERSDWQFISSMISGSSWQKCKFRWLSLRKVKLVTHKWSKAESKLLSETVTSSAKINWKLVAEKLFENNSNKNKVFRTAKQCREHWNCFLNPNIQKGPWTIQEDRRLLEYVIQLQGSKKWSEISKFLEGRTQNALKNRFNLLLDRQRKISGTLTEKRLLKICLNRLMIEQGQSQQRQELESMIQNPSITKPKDISSNNEKDKFEQSRIPILPTVVESVQYPTTQQLQFGNEFDFYELLRSNQSSQSGAMMSNVFGANSPVFIGFMFPGNFIGA